MRYVVKELGEWENDTPVRFYVQDTYLGYATDLMTKQEAEKTAKMMNEQEDANG
jgi:hypothetical protein